MKISPIVNPSATINPNEGHSATPQKIERAKLIAAGQSIPDAPAKPEKTSRDIVQESMKKIRMKTQRTPGLQVEAPAPAVEAPIEAAIPVESDIPEPIEQTSAVTEATKPLSPQLAALAREKRQLQLQKQELEAKTKALEVSQAGKTSLEEYRARIKANALSVLQEEGVTYDQLTEQILANNDDKSAVIALEAKMKALEESFDKKLETHESTRQEREEESALTEMLYQAEALAKDGEAYELIRSRKAFDQVLRRIYTTYKQTGRVLDVNEAMDFIENKLLTESLELAKLKKVQSRLQSTTAPLQTAAVPQNRAGVKTMRTLTNRDGATSSTMSKRERAIAAMEGRLYK